MFSSSLTSKGFNNSLWEKGINCAFPKKEKMLVSKGKLWYYRKVETGAGVSNWEKYGGTDIWRDDLRGDRIT